MNKIPLFLFCFVLSLYLFSGCSNENPMGNSKPEILKNPVQDKATNNTVLFTSPFYHDADCFEGDLMTLADLNVSRKMTQSPALTELFNSTGVCLDIRTGDRLALSATIRSRTGMDEVMACAFEVIGSPAKARKVTPFKYRVATLAQLLFCAQDFISGDNWNLGAGSNAGDVRISVTTDGRIRVENGRFSRQAVQELYFSNDRAASSRLIGRAFSIAREIPVGGCAQGASPILRPARASDPLEALYDAQGEKTGFLENGTMNLPANVGNAFQEAGGSANTLGEAMESIRTSLGLPEWDGTMDYNPSVSIASVGSGAIPAGALVIRGQPDPGALNANLAVDKTN